MPYRNLHGIAVRAVGALPAFCLALLASYSWAGAQIEEPLSASVQASLQAAISDRAFFGRAIR